MSSIPSDATPVAAALPTFDVRPYRPDYGFPVAGVTMLFSALVVTGAVLGYVAHWVSQYFYLIILFPVAIGIAMGAVGAVMVKFGRVRNPWIGGIAGLLGGVAAAVFVHYFDYRAVRSAIDDFGPEFHAIAALPADARAQFLNPDLNAAEMMEFEQLVELSRLTTFPAYVDYAAQKGVSIGSSRGNGVNLGYHGTYLYWAVELLIIAGITYVMTRSATAEPFCVPCGEWKAARTLGYLGTTDPAFAQGALASGDLSRLAEAKPSKAPSPLRVTLARCPHCPAPGGGDPDLKLDLVTYDGNGKENKQTLAHTTYPAAAVPSLDAIFSAPPLPPAAEPAPSGA